MYRPYRKNYGKSSAQYHQFFIEIKKYKRIWTLRDDKGFPRPMTFSGKRSMPFWSSLKRVRNIIEHGGAYSLFESHEISYRNFIDQWFHGLKKDNLLVGINWTGNGAIGYDLEPSEVLKYLNNLYS
ncbi:DUF2750 domain-containing protein [Leptospira alstonii]|uniref:DUF2750 domain-containing protein n=1 Tax=Leptospira alstonii TaxID=28452 RepID=UPI0005622AA8|nr:DUF2750 domain-containing protein [Leptospira alstonii]